jgi:hypothetical protein
MRAITISILLLFLLGIVTGCDNDAKSAMDEVAKYHANYNLKQFNKIYKTQLSEEFHHATSEVNYNSFMNNTYNTLGAYKNKELRKTNDLKSLMGEDKVELTFHTIYGNYELDEFFVLKIESGNYKIKQIVYDDIHAKKINHEK